MGRPRPNGVDRERPASLTGGEADRHLQANAVAPVALRKLRLGLGQLPRSGAGADLVVDVVSYVVGC